MARAVDSQNRLLARNVNVQLSSDALLKSDAQLLPRAARCIVRKAGMRR
jgi:hypothetical protein